MTYTIVICYPCPVTRQQRAQSSSIWSMGQATTLALTVVPTTELSRT